MEAKAREPGSGSDVGKSAADTPMTPPQALARAWLVWGGLIGLILLVAVAVLWVMVLSQTGTSGAPINLKPEQEFDFGGAQGGLTYGMIPLYVGMGLLALSMAGLFVRRRYFAAYYRGERVAAGNYLAGMLWVWLPIGAAVLVSEVMTLVTDNYFPTPVPALVGTILLFIFVPNGHAMTRPVGGTDDPGSYEEPK